MLQMTEARYDDVQNVMPSMSEVSLGEMEASGVSNAWMGLKRAKRFKDKGFLKVMKDDAEPLFIFGGIELDPGVVSTWFIGTEKYFDPSNRKAAIATARAMERTAQRMPRHVFEATTASRHENVIRWFGMLGFSFIEHKNGLMKFRYVGRKLAKAGKYASLLS